MKQKKILSFDSDISELHRQRILKRGVNIHCQHVHIVLLNTLIIQKIIVPGGPVALSCRWMAPVLDSTLYYTNYSLHEQIPTQQFNVMYC